MNLSPNIELKSKLEKPEEIGAVITQRKNKVNLCPVNWQVVSSEYKSPMVVCIGLSHGNYSREVILATKEFTYAYPSQEQLKDILYCGTVSGREVNKLKQMALQFLPAKKNKCPILKDAVLNFECTLMQTVEMETFSILIGKIEIIHGSDKSALDKIYALGGMEYGVIEKVKILQTGRT